MAFGFPAYHTETVVLEDLPTSHLRKAVLHALGTLGWLLAEQTEETVIAAVGFNFWSMGERIAITFLDDGRLSITSKCVMFTQCNDWGKNEQNVRVLIDELQKAALLAGWQNGAADSGAARKSEPVMPPLLSQKSWNLGPADLPSFAWSKTRQMGRTRFIWLVGVLGFGGAMGLFGVPIVLLGVPSPMAWFLLLLFPIGGYCFGALLWAFSEAKYAQASTLPHADRVVWPATVSVGRCLLLLSPLIAAGVGVWCNWAWLEAEHHRMQPWMIPVFWLGDLVGLALYLWFGVNSFRSQPSADGTASRNLWIAIPTALLIIGFKLAMTLTNMFEEESAYLRSAAARGQIIAAEVRPCMDRGTLYGLECRFKDKEGRVHEGTFFLSQKELPPELAMPITDGKLPVPAGIRYDPTWPNRNWIAANPDPHYNRLYFLSFATTVFGGLITGLLFCWPGRKGIPPGAGAFLGTAVLMFMMGMARSLNGET